MLIEYFLGTFAYTMVYTTTPIRNATAIAEAVRSSLMDRNYRQARTKATAVIKVCLLKVAISHMRSTFETALSVAIHFDSTTINSKKILVITAKSYIPEKGIVTQIIDLQSVITETADDLAEHIMVAVRNAGINPINVHSICADNANVNFGGVNHKQGQNAATKLEEKMEHSLIDIGCFAHIFNNGYEKGYKAFESFFNMERIVFSTRNSFHQKVQPTEAFKKIAQEEQINLLKLKTLSFTRWASSYNALKSLYLNYPVLKMYYQSKIEEQKKKPKKTKYEPNSDDYKYDPFSDNGEDEPNPYEYDSNSDEDKDEPNSDEDNDEPNPDDDNDEPNPDDDTDEPNSDDGTDEPNSDNDTDELNSDDDKNEPNSDEDKDDQNFDDDKEKLRKVKKSKKPKGQMSTEELNNFYSSNINYVWIELLLKVTERFHLSSQKVQGEEISLMEGRGVATKLKDFCNNTQNTINLLFDTDTSLGSNFADLDSNEQSKIRKGITTLLTTSGAYLTQWLEEYDQYSVFNWVLLDKTVELNEVKETLNFLESKGISIEYTRQSLIDEIDSLNEAFREIYLFEDRNESPLIEKWNKVLETMRLNNSLPDIMQQLSSIALSLSPSNSVPEGIFSQMKHFWSDRKANIDFWSVFAFIMIKFNLCKTISIAEFKKDFLEKDDDLLREIRSNSKFDVSAKRQQYNKFSEFVKKELSELYLPFEIVFENDDNAVYLN